jgi:hypothetical protein
MSGPSPITVFKQLKYTLHTNTQETECTHMHKHAQIHAHLEYAVQKVKRYIDC